MKVGSEQSMLVRDARVNFLRVSQTEFAKYLNDLSEIESETYTQSAVSKYENGGYKVPSEVLLVCQRLTKRLKSKKEYSVNSIIGKLVALDPEKNSHLLQMVENLLDEKTQK